MYTWGYIKENTLSKLNISEEEANQLGFLSRFPYCANEAMTQICSAIKPRENFYNFIVIEPETTIEMPDDFLGFSDDIVRYAELPCDFDVEKYKEEGDEYPIPKVLYDEAYDTMYYYAGYNKFVCHEPGIYIVPYKARWFFFTKDLHNATELDIPADICDAIPSYIASQCLKIDDEIKASIFRNEYEMALARIDDTSFKTQRTFTRGGGW